MIIICISDFLALINSFHNRSSDPVLYYLLILAVKRRKEDTFGMNDEDWDVYKQIVSKVENKQPSIMKKLKTIFFIFLLCFAMLFQQSFVILFTSWSFFVS